MRNFIGRGNSTFFIGVVEDRDDPVQLGRVRVRCFGWHTDDKGQIPTENLPWALVLGGTDSASISGVGKSPNALVTGSWVFGFFIDGERAQEPLILGSLLGAPTEEVDALMGFNDPNGVYPKYIRESDVNRLARGTNTKTHTPDSSIGEPDAPYSAQYPYNRVMETESGHAKEYDDTPNHERIREWHKSGTFYEIGPDGDVVTHIVRDRYSVVHRNDSVHVKGNVKILVDGNVDFDCADLNINASTGTITIGSGDVIASGISLVNHTHTDTPGLGAGTTSKPN